MNHKPRLLRITTVPISLHVLLKGQLTFMREQGLEVCTASADGSEREEIRKQQIEHHVVSGLTRRITPIQDLIALSQLVQIIRRFKPDIVHTHTPKAGLLGMLASWICRVPIRMHTVAGLPVMESKGLKRWILRLTEQLTYRCANHVYPNSVGLLTYIESEFNIQRSKFKVIGKGSSNGIDTNHFTRNAALEQQAEHIRNQLGISKSEIVFSFVGRLVNDKGITELVNAFTKLRDVLPARLILIGSFEEDLDPLQPEIMSRIESDSQIMLAGFQKDVRPWMMASDVFVFPSYREGFPNVVMQAACLEIPCIVSNINGSNEIIEANQTGLIVPAKNTDALYDAMFTLANDESLRLSFGRKSREFVQKNFDQRHVWNELLKEYTSLVKNHG